MSCFNDAITKLKRDYKYPSCCAWFFKRDPLAYALSKYNNTQPTNEQILAVISAFLIYHRNDPQLTVFAQDIQQAVKNNLLTTARVEQLVYAWLLLNKNKFLSKEYMSLIEELDQLDALVNCLHVLDELEYLDQRQFNALLSHINSLDILRSIFNKLKDAKLLNDKKNIDVILQLPSYANIDADAFFNGVFVFNTQLNNLPVDTTITQSLFNRLIDENEKQYWNVFNNGNAYQPSIPKINNTSANNLKLFSGLATGLTLTSVGAMPAIQASVIAGLK